MAKVWTSPEIKLLKQIVERYGRSAEYNKQKIAYEFAKSYPNRTFEGIRAKMKEIRQSKQYYLNLPLNSDAPSKTPFFLEMQVGEMTIIIKNTVK